MMNLPVIRLPQKFNVWLTINRACNLRCEWCYATVTEFAAKETMSLDLADQLIQMIKSLPVGHVSLIGGEPTIHPHFHEIISRLKAAGQTVAVVSNSIRFSDENFLARSIDAGLSAILTSFKAGDEPSYHQCTGVKGAFSKAVQALQNINSSSVPHEVSVIVNDGLYNNFPRVLEILVESGTKHVLIDTERPVMMDGGLNAANFPDCRKIAEFLTEIYPLLKQSGVKFTKKIIVKT